MAYAGPALPFIPKENPPEPATSAQAEAERTSDEIDTLDEPQALRLDDPLPFTKVTFVEPARPQGPTAPRAPAPAFTVPASWRAASAARVEPGRGPRDAEDVGTLDAPTGSSVPDPLPFGRATCLVKAEGVVAPRIAPEACTLERCAAITASIDREQKKIGQRWGRRLVTGGQPCAGGFVNG